MTRGLAPLLPIEFHKMGSFRRPRPRFMSSPVLSELPRFQAARQALQLSSNSAWNSVQTAVINVFKGGGLQSNELYALNEMVLTPLTEQEGEAYLEKCGSVRRHTVANAHSDIQLLAMATMMHSGLGEEAGGEDKHLLLPPSFPPPHRQCSSEPSILDSPDELELEDVASGSQEDSELNCASLS